jgi:16S rRNA (cytidine1402-2'-O)-methyltransferase
MVIVIAPPQEQQAEDIDALLRNALARVSVKDAVGEVALATGRSKREVYQRALELNDEGGDGKAR